MAVLDIALGVMLGMWLYALTDAIATVIIKGLTEA